MIRTYDDNMISSDRGKCCMSKFAKALKKMANIIINTPQKPMIKLTDNEKEQHKNSKRCFLCNKGFSCSRESEHYKNYKKVRDHDHYTGKHSICNLQYKIPKEIPVVFHNGSNYDYHFIINELAKGVDGMECLGENTEKYITIKVPIEKETKDGEFTTLN